MKKESMKISGMSCNHCVMRVKNALSELDGVSSADVSLEDGGKADVSFDESKVDMKKLKDAVAEAGYSVEG